MRVENFLIAAHAVRGGAGSMIRTNSLVFSHPDMMRSSSSQA